MENTKLFGLKNRQGKMLKCSDSAGVWFTDNKAKAKMERDRLNCEAPSDKNLGKLEWLVTKGPHHRRSV